MISKRKELSVEVWKKLILEVMLREPKRKWSEFEIKYEANKLAIERGLKSS